MCKRQTVENRYNAIELLINLNHILVILITIINIFYRKRLVLETWIVVKVDTFIQKLNISGFLKIIKVCIRLKKLVYCCVTNGFIVNDKVNFSVTRTEIESHLFQLMTQTRNYFLNATSAEIGKTFNIPINCFYLEVTSHFTIKN